MSVRTYPEPTADAALKDLRLGEHTALIGVQTFPTPAGVTLPINESDVTNLVTDLAGKASVSSLLPAALTAADSIRTFPAPTPDSVLKNLLPSLVANPGQTVTFPGPTYLTSPVAIADGGTGQTAKQAAFDALSPAVTTGDIEYYSGTHVVPLAIGNTWSGLGVAAGIPAWSARGRVALGLPPGVAVGSIATTASVAGSWQTAFALNELAIGDVIRFSLAVEMFNNSGGAAVMSTSLQVRSNGGASGATIAQTLTSLSVASSATSTRTVYMSGIMRITALPASNLMTYSGNVLANVSGANVNLLVLANSVADELNSAIPCVSNVNGPVDFDVVVASNVNNAATTGKLISLIIEKAGR